MHIFYAKKLGRAWHQADCSLNEWAGSTTLVNPGVRLSPSSREKIRPELSFTLSKDPHPPFRLSWNAGKQNKFNIHLRKQNKTTPQTHQQQLWSSNFMIWLLRTGRYRASLSEGRQSQPVSSYIPIEDTTVSNPSSSALAIKDTSTALNQHSWFELEPACASMTVRKPNFHSLMLVISLPY